MSDAAGSIKAAAAREAMPAGDALDIRHHHGAVSVGSLDGSIEWYQRVLGFTVESRVDVPQIPAQVAMLRRGDLRIELFEVPGSGPASAERRIPDQDLKTRGTKHFSFAVKDVHAAADELRRRGADIVFVSDFEFASCAFIRDNEGNLIEFLQQPDLWR